MFVLNRYKINKMEQIDEICKMLGYNQSKINQIKKFLNDNPQMVQTMMSNIINQQGTNLPNNQKDRKKRTKPNEKCPCGSDKKYKKCCHKTEISSENQETENQKTENQKTENQETEKENL